MHPSFSVFCPWAKAGIEQKRGEQKKEVSGLDVSRIEMLRILEHFPVDHSLTRIVVHRKASAALFFPPPSFVYTRTKYKRGKFMSSVTVHPD